MRTVANVGDLTLFQRFVELCAGRISQPTAKAWPSIPETTFITFRLPAFHARVRKRLVKMPKLYFHDSGLACWLLGIREPGAERGQAGAVAAGAGSGFCRK